jgi:hypothetical protein
MTILEQDQAPAAENAEIPLAGPALPTISEPTDLRKTVAPLPSTGIAQITKATQSPSAATIPFIIIVSRKWKTFCSS